MENIPHEILSFIAAKTSKIQTEVLRNTSRIFSYVIIPEDLKEGYDDLSFELYILLDSHKIETREEVPIEAMLARNGNLELLKFLRLLFNNINHHLFVEAVRYNQYAIVEWVLDSKMYYCLEDALVFADGHMIDFILNNNVKSLELDLAYSLDDEFDIYFKRRYVYDRKNMKSMFSPKLQSLLETHEQFRGMKNYERYELEAKFLLMLQKKFIRRTFMELYDEYDDKLHIW